MYVEHMAVSIRYLSNLQRRQHGSFKYGFSCFFFKENRARQSEKLVKKEKQCSEYLEIIQYFFPTVCPKMYPMAHWF